MSSPLDVLHAREVTLLAAIPQRGTFEERAELFSERRVPEEWTRVLGEYSRLLDDPLQRSEALRRALFLVWYWWNEPWQLTGMRDRDEAIELQVLQALESEMQSPNADIELRSMLGGYGDGLPFDQHPEFAETLSFVRLAVGVDPSVPFRNLEARGSMGAYWLSRNDRPK